MKNIIGIGILAIAACLSIRVYEILESEKKKRDAEINKLDAETEDIKAHTADFIKSNRSTSTSSSS